MPSAGLTLAIHVALLALLVAMTADVGWALLTKHRRRRQRVAANDIDMDAILAQREEATGAADTFAFTFKSQRWTAKHPLLADDEWNEQLQELQGNVEVAEHYMGADQYEQFTEAGGYAGVVIFAVREEARRMANETTDGRPTRSSNSSERTRRRSKQT